MPTFKNTTRKNTNEPIFKKRSPDVQRTNVQRDNVTKVLEDYKKTQPAESDGKQKINVDDLAKGASGDSKKRKLSIDSVVANFEKALNGSKSGGGADRKQAPQDMQKQAQQAISKAENAALNAKDLTSSAKRDMMERILAKVSKMPDRQGDAVLLQQALTTDPGEPAQKKVKTPQEMAEEVEKAMERVVEQRKRVQEINQAQVISQLGGTPTQISSSSSQMPAFTPPPPVLNADGARQDASMGIDLNRAGQTDPRIAELEASRQKAFQSFSAQPSRRSPQDILEGAQKIKDDVFQSFTELTSQMSTLK